MAKQPASKKKKKPAPRRKKPAPRRKTEEVLEKVNNKEIRREIMVRVVSVLFILTQWNLKRYPRNILGIMVWYPIAVVVTCISWTRCTRKPAVPNSRIQKNYAGLCICVRSAPIRTSIRTFFAHLVMQFI